ncbi:Uncharacterised protein [Aeromonas encheleia]|uniref:hypothetical protein n=1 Tax=Aeromonas encheleia TaxID=73010 RepID=UPI0009FDF996|nr:hypothetical protein [Aeromonas encheleia]VEG96376.1 Uncharacterised protein [Aeromonas encheleia]
MKLEQMPGARFITLAEWPSMFIESSYTKFFMSVLKIKDDLTLHWYKKYKQDENGSIRLDLYDDLKIASSTATENNKLYIQEIDQFPLSVEEKKSLRLKVEKAVTSKERLLNEEVLMLREAIRLHKNVPKKTADNFVFPNLSQDFKDAAVKILNETPYIKVLYVPPYGVILHLKEHNDWSQRNIKTKKAIQLCYRERIAGGFGLSGAEHWGKTKAKIRTMLLPRANKLLQLASVKLLLADAKARGQKVLLAGDFVFWYEDNGNVGWEVKAVGDSGSNSAGNTLWKEGKILSKNHGRIVVFPYIKENDEHVKGHTKNAPNDGKALLRHPNDYIELPFEVLEDDLMIGLFGELRYE